MRSIRVFETQAPEQQPACDVVRQGIIWRDRTEARAFVQSDRFRLSHAGIEPHLVVASDFRRGHDPVSKRAPDAVPWRWVWTNIRFLSQMPSPRSRKATQPAAFPA